MVKIFTLQESDMIAAALMTTPERREVLDFTSPFLLDSLSIMYKKPARPIIDYMMWVFMPFTEEVWVLLGIVTAVVNKEKHI